MSLKRKKIFLHIGTPKTGTTSIQNALFHLQQSGILQKNSFYYDNNAWSAGEEKNYCYPHPFFKINPISTYLRNVLKKCATENIILSRESFTEKNINDICILTGENAELFAEELADHDVKIIIYLRRQDLYLESIWSQWMKCNHSKLCFATASSLIEKSLHYKDIINKYAHFFGKRNIIIRIFEKETLVKKDVVADFLQCVGLDFLEAPKMDKFDENLSLSPQALRLMQAYNYASRISHEKCLEELEILEGQLASNKISAITYSCRKRCLLDGSHNDYKSESYYRFMYPGYVSNHSSFGFMQPGERRAFLAQYEEDNAAIAREYFGREDGKLFNDKFPENIVSLDEPSTTDIVTVFLPIFQHLHERIEHLEHQITNTQNTRHAKNIETRLNTIERRLGYIKAPWKVLPVIVRRIRKLV